MKFPVKLIVPEIESCSDITLPYIVDDDGIVVVCKCTIENGLIIVEALNNYTSRTDCNDTKP